MTRATILSTMLLALAALSARAAHAQAEAVPLPQPGARVRAVALSAEGRWESVAGTLVTAGGDSLVVAPERRGGPVVLRTSRVAVLQTSTGRRSRSLQALGYGAGWGMLGFVGGCGLGGPGGGGGGGYLSSGAGCMLGGTLLGILTGFGGLVHEADKAVETWRPVALPRPTPSIEVPTGGGVGASVSLRP